MRFVGIDVAAEEHYFAIVDESGKLLRGATRFGENAVGYGKFFECLGESSDALVCMEATGHYWKNLAAHLYERGFQVALVNPLRTSRFAGEDLRRSKTDAIDAVSIARFAAQKKLLPTKLPDELTEELRELVRYRDRVVQEMGDKTRLLHRQVDLVFPEFTTAVSDLSSFLALKILENWPSARSLSRVSWKRVAEVVYDGRHKVGQEKAERLINLACASVAKHSGEVYRLQVTRLCEDLIRLKKHLAELDRAIDETTDRHDIGKLLQSIEGVGTQTAARLVSELGDPSEFASAKKLAAYVGTIPSIRESGKHRPRGAALSNLGNHKLRRALWMPVLSAVRKNPWLRAFYERLKARGKSSKTALCAAMRKLLIAVWWVSKHRKPFDSRLVPLES